MPATRKHLHISKPRRRQRSVSLSTRASRCGVKNYINVMKSIHPNEESFFPVTKEYMEEYIATKKKQGSIKANSLDQYFQHIESYNMAMEHGWDAEIFEPMMRDVLEELEKAEGKNPKKKTGKDDEVQDETENTTPPIQLTLVCYDNSSSPPTRIDPVSKLVLPDLSTADSVNALKLVYEALSKHRHSKRWGEVDKTTLYYRLESWDADQRCPLADDDSFKMFWTSVCGQAEGGSAVQLVVYGKRNTNGNAANGGRKVNQDNRDVESPKTNLVIGTNINHTPTNLPLAPLTPRKSPPRLSNTGLDMITGLFGMNEFNNFEFPNAEYSPVSSPTFQQIRSVTIRSPSKVYKNNIAVTDNTTFESLINFAFKKPPPSGKQFVLMSANGELEYMPGDVVRKAIHGVGHADVIVRVEDVREVDFSHF
ncbi:9088_t:CDS:2 [Paraglomus brasilianum]|uniref:9088_t:CDS:1 n=1 Tax=Paraglomus brasilianum TaxID=144538 RepID=A0A9N8Z2R7_9GLOM|nr:9088_t:CDS:2 [Paraglomus brasilianum]